jgi:hypothetical protein
MKQFSRRSLLSSVASLPAFGISARAYSTADKEISVRHLKEGNVNSPLCKTIKSSLAAPNRLRWFRL